MDFRMGQGREENVVVAKPAQGQRGPRDVGVRTGSDQNLTIVPVAFAA
jgi:hypothetical protein